MKNNQLRQVVFPILAAFIWGTAFVAQDVCADAMGAFTFNGTRYYIAVLSLLVVLAVSSGFRKDRPQISPAEKKAQRRQLWLGGFCCGTVLAIASNFQQAGLVAGTDGGKAGFITALYVVLVPVFGLFFRRKVSLPVWIAVALSVGALYLLCIKGSFSLAPGDLLVLVCAICFSVHILVIDHFTATCDGVKLSCLQFLFAGTWSTILALFFDTISLQVLLDCICGRVLLRRGLHPANPGSEGLQSHGGHHSAEPGERVRRHRRCRCPAPADDRPGISGLRADVRGGGPGPDPHAPEKGSQSRINRTHNKSDAAAAASVFYPPVLPIHRNSSGPSHFFTKT